ncbi:MAG: (2Fe-2S)-binding protein [Candidatus Hodarchaeales archaeon]|jgi:aerobic-type carbon monoxide dehydrogenase small subunit (CoxS/CutS family)
MTEITIIVNGRKHILEVDPEEKLLFFLRERLQLTGTKCGCNQGHCSTCTVVINGKAVKACLIKTAKLDGKEILTIEGISPNSPDEDLHPIQKAFIETTAVQCGFCTPGLIMELYALFSHNPSAMVEDIKKALKGHLCRCTGYKPILDAALLAKKSY